MNESDVLLDLIERVKIILTARATGSEPDNEEYKKIRGQLIKNIKIKSFLPSMLKSCGNLDEFWSYIQPKFPRYAERRDHIKSEFIPLISFLENTTALPIHEHTTAALSLLKDESVIAEWTKALERKDKDPKGAITISRTLLENLFKQLLSDLSIEYSDSDDIPQLYNLLANALTLSPGQHTDQIFKQILNGCYSIIQGLTGLRNKASDAHASIKKPVKPAERHAEFVVNISGALAIFLIKTWKFNKEKSPPKLATQVVVEP